MELIGTMPQSIYKKSLFIVCCGFALKRDFSAMLPSPQWEPALCGAGPAAEAQREPCPEHSRCCGKDGLSVSELCASPVCYRRAGRPPCQWLAHSLELPVRLPVPLPAPARLRTGPSAPPCLQMAVTGAGGKG